jgi:hypothetical protein
MLTQNEINSLSLSPTKKDFVQIWNELLDVAGKLSERWDPTSTNESDPGIVILKALAGIADKLNYNIDKNILEAFMPTAAQEDSMRKLCDMLGYNIKYNQSAVTEVTIKYHNSAPSEDEESVMASGLLIPKFSVITNNDQDINYFIIPDKEYPAPANITSKDSSKVFRCMEGQLVKCESFNDDNIITASQISEDNRFYLPEAQVAENGIFIYNIFNYGQLVGDDALTDGEAWEKVDNLNIQVRGSKVYKFGYDSYEGRPYIEFPEDYAELFSDGIFIYYTRTNGASGNVSARVLTKFEMPTDGDWGKVSAESFSVENSFAATTGANAETIKQSYNNFKKTVGTFETLVTCRDYMNKIYLLTTGTGKPLVSNILVTDIRNDLNKAVTICSCDRAGIFYKEGSRLTDIPASEITKPVFNSESEPYGWRLGSKSGMELTNFITKAVNEKNPTQSVDAEFSKTETGIVGYDDGYWTITQNDIKYTTNLPVGETKSAIDHFDLIFYPFKSYNQVKNNLKDLRRTYDASFTYTSSTFNEIQDRLKALDVETIAHNIKLPEPGDIISINNYLRLNATIATNSKITTEEGSMIIEKIKIDLANAFNMRELDFGEEIPFDSIVEVIENADSRIRVASLNEPSLYTTFSVLEDIDESNTPIIKEYAVESDWLTLEAATDADRFDVDKLVKDKNDDLISISTFNTKKAREYYNLLAVRNVLAGRVPLFNYNKTFKTTFSEAAYQVTREATSIPVSLPAPSPENPYTICSYANKVYTGQYIAEDNIKYTETSTPDNLPEEFVNNILTTVYGNAITDITTSCNISAPAGLVSGVKLGSGEYVKFRAPNFITTKTYPAYVNYHLELATEEIEAARNAEAVSLFEILNQDKYDWNGSDKTNNWQKMFDYFAQVDKTRPQDSHYIQPAVQTQTISAFSTAASVEGATCSSSENLTGQHVDDGTGKCIYCGTKILNTVQKGPILIDIPGDSSGTKEDLVELLNISGCLKLVNDTSYNAATGLYEVKAGVAWADTAGAPDLDIRIALNSPFITDSVTLSQIEESVQNRLEEMVGQVREDGVTPLLPTEGAWTITFNYEYVPFRPSTLPGWRDFIGSKIKDLAGFDAVTEGDIIFWRVYGEGYAIGKYITQSTEKLLAFDRTYFGLLPESRLRGVYLVKDLGQDAQSAIITNDTEYKLRANEYLYIEYTPSTTSEDGTAKEAAAVTEILGPGTIIRPSGFDVGLMDSSRYNAEGHSYFKSVDFETATGASKRVDMHRFGANEQVEIRDFAKVELTKDTFKSTSAIYYYKNFNNCPELEDPTFEGPRVYTLKEGEYIFYTDYNKSELAYFTSGTQVSLSSNIYLEQFEVIELATIFESGLSEIPWRYLGFKNSTDKITFQEYQYITLGPEDTIKNLKLIGKTGSVSSLDNEWVYCDEVVYTPAGSEDSERLPAISAYDEYATSGKGCGWEVCSILQLDVDANSAQVLRKTDQVQDSIWLRSVSHSGGGLSEDPVEITPIDADHPLSFKTNLSCQSSSAHITLDDVYNPNKLKGFEFKIYAQELPAIVETAWGRVVPRRMSVTDIADWPGTDIASTQTSSISWTEIGFDRIQAFLGDAPHYDCALRLPISVIPNTYCIFSLYTDFVSSVNASNKVWIEVAPGITPDDITIFNVAKNEVEWENLNSTDNTAPRLLLKPGINCIRVNKTCKLFIKASASTQGSLFYDEPKLVNIDTIQIETEGKVEIPNSTYGLNIKQLGYLNPDEVTDLSNVLAVDEELRTDLKTGCVSEAFSALESLKTTKKNALLECQKELVEEYSIVENLQKIIKLASAAKEDVAAAIKAIEENNLNTSTFVQLLEAFKSVFDRLTKEEALFNTLKEYPNRETLQNEFISLLESSMPVEQLQVNLLAQVKDVAAEALKEVDNLTDGKVLADFEANYKLNDIITNEITVDSSILTKIINASIAKIDIDYGASLAPLLTKISKVVNSDERANLLTLVSSAKEAQSKAQQTEVLTQLKQLLEAINRSDLYNLLEAMLTAAIAPDYQNLDVILHNLRAYFQNKKFSTLSTELELAATESPDDHLKNIIIAMQDLVVENNKYDAKITEIINEVQTIHEGSSEDVYESSRITGMVKELYNSIYTGYEGDISDILDLLYSEGTNAEGEAAATGLIAALDAQNNKYNSVIKQLQNSNDAQVTAILNEITELSANQAAAINSATNLKYKVAESIDLAGLLTNVQFKEHLDTLPHRDLAICTAWKSYLVTSTAAAVESLINDMSKTIESLKEEDAIQLSIASINTLLTKSTSSFDALRTDIIELTQRHKQNQLFKNFISGLSLPGPSGLDDKVQDIVELLENEADPDDLVYKQLRQYDSIVNAGTSTQADKQKAARVLENALSKNITVLKLVAKSIAGTLCPNILLVEEQEDLSKNSKGEIDTFYERYVELIGDLRTNLLNKSELELSDYLTECLSTLEAQCSKTSANGVLLKAFNGTSLYDSLKTDSTALLDSSALPTEVKADITDNLIPLVQDLNIIEETFNKDLANFNKTALSNLETWVETISDVDIHKVISGLIADLSTIVDANGVTESSKSAYDYLVAEEHLLENLRAIDIGRDFYYTAPVNLNLAIEFNESDSSLNTLMNPLMNYDINNVNNSFVISKLDIDYLDKGLQIARSSRIN